MKTYICPNCGSQTVSPAKKHPSSFAAELGVWLGCILVGVFTNLWIVMVIPVGFSIWRQAASAGLECRDCKQVGMIPSDTPRGKELAAQYQKSTEAG